MEAATRSGINGVKQPALQQLLLAKGLLQLLALANLVDHAKQRYWLALLVIEGDLVDLHPTGAIATVAVQLLIEQRIALCQQAIILFPKDVAPWHLYVRLADELFCLLQPGLLHKRAVGKQVAPVRIPTEDIHGQLIDDLL